MFHISYSVFLYHEHVLPECCNTLLFVCQLLFFKLPWLQNDYQVSIRLEKLLIMYPR